MIFNRKEINDLREEAGHLNNRITALDSYLRDQISENKRLIKSLQRSRREEIELKVREDLGKKTKKELIDQVVHAAVDEEVDKLDNLITAEIDQNQLRERIASVENSTYAQLGLSIRDLTGINRHIKPSLRL